LETEGEDEEQVVVEGFPLVASVMMATHQQFTADHFGRILAPTWISDASRIMDVMDPAAIRTELPKGRAKPGGLLMLPAIPLPRDHGLPVGVPVVMEAITDVMTLVQTWSLPGTGRGSRTHGWTRGSQWQRPTHPRWQSRQSCFRLCPS